MISKSASGLQSVAVCIKAVRVLTRRLPIETGILPYWVLSYITSAVEEGKHTSKVLNVETGN